MAWKVSGRARRCKRSVGLNRGAFLGVLSAGEDRWGVGAVGEVLLGELEARCVGRNLWVESTGELRGGVLLAGCVGVAARGAGWLLRKVEGCGKD